MKKIGLIVSLLLFAAGISYAAAPQKVPSDLKVGGKLTVGQGIAESGKYSTAPASQTGICVTSAVVVTSNFMVLSATGAITSTAAPFISTATATNPNGTRVTLIGGSANVLTVQDNDQLANSCLELGASTRALGLGDILRLIIYNGKWYEEGFVNN